LASSINASTTAGVVTTADTSGLLALQTAGTTALTVDTSQNVGVGTTSPAYKLDVQNAGGLSVRVNNTSSTSPAQFRSTNTLTTVNFGVDSTGGYVETQGAYPTLFYTNSTERMRVNAGAPILCLAGGNTSATGTGIAFPATQSASTDANTLDDYEEGTWTPNLTGDGGGSGQTYTAQTGTYTKVGRVVTVGFYINLSAKGTITGNVIISNLPFSVLNSGAIVYGGALALWLNLAVNHNVIGIYCNTNTTNIYFWGSTGTASSAPVLTTTDIANTTRFWGSATYMTA